MPEVQEPLLEPPPSNAGCCDRERPRVEEAPVSKILLVEPDYYTRYPPLGLLKLAAYHRKRGDEVRLVRGNHSGWKPDRVYVTSLFSYAWRPVHAAVQFYRNTFPKARVVLGGIYASLLPDHALLSGTSELYVGLHPGAESSVPAWDLVPEWDGSILFASRGCIRKCGFCSVPKLEGPPTDFRLGIRRQVMDYHRRVILWDNNILGNPNWKPIFDQLIELDREVDFNQGLDARLITEDIAVRVAEIKTKSIRLAYDYPGIREGVRRGIENLAAAGVSRKKLVVYTLYNYIDTPEQFFGKVKDLLSWGVASYPMRFEPLTSLTKNAYVSPRWTREELNQVASARRVLGYAGAFPSYKGLSKKMEAATSFMEAFALRSVGEKRYAGTTGHLGAKRARFGGNLDWRRAPSTPSESVAA